MLQRRTQDAGPFLRQDKLKGRRGNWCELTGARGFDPVEAEERYGAPEEFGPGATFA